MNTHHQATHETAIKRFERRMSERDAKRDAEAAKLDKDYLRWQVTLFIATISTTIVVVGIATGFLAVLIRLPPAAAI